MILAIKPLFISYILAAILTLSVLHLNSSNNLPVVRLQNVSFLVTCQSLAP